MKGRFGMESVDFDPSDKYLKPAGFGNPDAPHYEYIEYGRKPWQYRVGGASVVRGDKYMPYPRVCAHRGMNTTAPENTMPAFGMAVALGAEEIEFDLWPTVDGEIVSCHDPDLDRVSTGTGRVVDYTYDELLKFDFGVKYSEKYKGLKIVTFEEILKKFAGRVIMNVHIKPLSDTEPYPEAAMKRIVSLVRQYDAQDHVYFMISPDVMIKQFKAYAPDIPVCVGHFIPRPWEIVERAIELGCEKVQLFKPYFSEETVKKAHENGIICNVFYADDENEAKEYIKMGIDTILTNDYNIISQAVREVK